MGSMHAAAFLLARLLLARQPTPQTDQLASLAGTVVLATSKEPVHKSARDPRFIRRTSDETGHFRFADVKPGRYKLTVEKSGFLDGAYGGSEPEDEGFS